MKKIYNILFPMWFLFILPSYLWIVFVVGNFVVDSLVTIYNLKKQNVDNYMNAYKKSIIKVWVIGFVSDILGSLFLLGLMLVLNKVLEPTDIVLDWITFPWCTILAIPGVIVAGVLIYFLNKKLSFTKTNLSTEQIRLISKYLALITAPYVMLIPLYF